MDRGLGDIRAYPPGSHAGIVVLRLTDQSAATATKAVTDLTTLPNPDSLAGAAAVLQRGLLRIRHPSPLLRLGAIAHRLRYVKVSLAKALNTREIGSEQVRALMLT